MLNTAVIGLRSCTCGNECTDAGFCLNENGVPVYAEPGMSDAELIKAASEFFGDTFGLKAFPEDTFRIQRAASYVAHGMRPRIMLYVYRQVDGDWLAFAKGTVVELLGQAVV